MFKTRVTVPIPLYFLYQLCDSEEVLSVLASGRLVRYMHLAVPRDPRDIIYVDTDDLVRGVVTSLCRSDPVVRFFMDMGVPFEISSIVRECLTRFYLEDVRASLRQVIALLFLDPAVYVLDLDLDVVFEKRNSDIIPWLRLRGMPRVRFVLDDRCKICIEDSDFCITEL